MIYIITDGNKFKIGKSKHPEKRLKQLQTGCAKRLSLLKSYDRPDYYEKRLHYILKRFSYRIKSEWFVCSDQEKLIKIIENIINS